MRTARLLWEVLGKYRRYAIGDLLAIAAETVLELFIPLLMATAIDEGISRGDVGLIIRQGALMLVCALGALLLGLVHAWCISRLSNGMGAGLRRAEYERIQSFSFGNIDRYRASSLVTRMTSDITVIQNAINNGFRPMIRGPLMLVLGLAYASTFSIELVGVFFCTLPVLGVALALIVGGTAPRFRTLQDSMDHLNSVVREDLTAIRAVKAYVRGQFERDRFEEVNQELRERSTGTFSRSMLNQPVFQLVMYTTSVLVLWFGGQMVMAGTLMVGQLTGFMSYINQIMNSLMMISNVFLQVTRALTSVDRCVEVLGEVPEIESPAYDAILEVPDGSIEFEDVSFVYDRGAEKSVLEHVSLSVPSGATIGILGGTGSGKSSLVQLVARLYDASEGRVLVGGHDVREYDLSALRGAVGIVLQKNVLFTGTVRENLLWGDPEATDDELLRACKTACVDEFLDRIGGLDGSLGQGGANVSGGQKQRLCIARTLLKRPRILVFDDSTSAVDVATEARIRENLGRTPGMTTLIIAQRITSVMDADEIFVLDDGKVHAHGTHRQLLASDSIYQEIYASQMEFADALSLRLGQGEDRGAVRLDG